MKQVCLLIAVASLLLYSCSRTSTVYEEGMIRVENGVELFYQKVGDGQKKIILPLGLYLYEGLKPLADSLECTLVFYDVRNRGRSSHVTDSSLISIWKDVEDLESVRKHFGYDKISVVGWSYLGMMVMLYATRHQQNIDRIVQLGPAALKWNEPFPEQYRNISPFPGDTALMKRAERLQAEGYHLKEPKQFTELWYRAYVFPGLFGDTANVRKFDKQLMQALEPENELYHHFMWHLNHHFMGSVQNMNTDSLWPEVKKITAPLLTIHGAKDRNAPYGAGRQWATEVPNARLVTIEGAAHLPWYENPGLVLHSMTKFLKGDWPAMAEKTAILNKIPTKTLNGPDGMVMDKDGNIYIANWGKDGKGSTVTKIDKNGNESIYLDSLSSPDGLTFDEQGNLYVSCFASGEIIKISADKERTLFASGLDHPSDCKFDAEGNLYVSCFGNFNGTKVIRITPAGAQTVLAGGLSVPLGLAFDDQQHLYVSNFGSGTINKLNRAGDKTVYAQVPDEPKGNLQYLAFDKDRNLYCPSYGHNCIYKIDKKGDVSKTSFVLNGPNSVYIRDDKLYFTEFNTGSLYFFILSLNTFSNFSSLGRITK